MAIFFKVLQTKRIIVFRSFANSVWVFGIALIVSFISFTLIVFANGLEQEQKLPRELAQFQKTYIEKLEQHALHIGKKGSPEYYSILRQGMEKLPFVFPQKESNKGEKDRPTAFDIKSLVANVRQSDRTPELQRRQDQKILSGKVGRKVVGERAIRVQKRKNFLNVVAIKNKNGICSGTLIGYNDTVGVVLTARHCVVDLQLQTQGGKIFFGLTTTPPNTHYVELIKDSIDCIVKCTASGFKGNDIAIIRFRKVEGPDDVLPAIFAKTDFYHEYKRVVVVGFGLNNNGKTGIKYRGDPLFEDAYCEHNTEICKEGFEAIYKSPGLDTCTGDSGGPAFIFINKKYQRLVAITSRAYDGAKCGPGGIYALVFGKKVTTWLKAKGVNIVAN